jgi:hypothetical protein
MTLITRIFSLEGLRDTECSSDDCDTEEILDEKHDCPCREDDNQSHDGMDNFIAGILKISFVSTARYPLDSADDQVSKGENACDNEEKIKCRRDYGSDARNTKSGR